MGDFGVNTSGTETGYWDVWDGANSRTILKANEGDGSVQVPNGNLSNKGNCVLTTADNVSGAADTIYMVADQGADDTDGTACDTEFADAISNTSEGDTIRFEAGGHFLLNNKHQIQKAVTLDLRGATLELMGVVDDWQIQFIPANTRDAYLSNGINITSNIQKGAYDVPVGDVAGYSRGDYILLYHDGPIDLSATQPAEKHVRWAVITGGQHLKEINQATDTVVTRLDDLGLLE